MRSTRLSIQSILTALDLDAACMPLLEKAPVHEALLRSYTPDAVYAAIHTIGDLLDRPQQAAELAESLEERINIVTHKLKFIADESRPRVLFLDDVAPAHTVHDTYLDTIARIAGGIPLQPDAGFASAGTIVVVSDKPVPELLAELPALLATPGWAETAAVKNGEVYIVHHPDHLKQPGALIADDIEILAEILYSGQFIFGRDEDAWMRFGS